MEQYNPHIDITNEEGRKALTELIAFEDNILSKPLSDLSLEELIVVREILIRRKEESDRFHASLAELASQKPDERAEVVTEKIIQDFYDMGHEFDKGNPDPADLEIVEGLIKKAEDSRKA